jgi:hypothetical protein
MHEPPATTIQPISVLTKLSPVTPTPEGTPDVVSS